MSYNISLSADYSLIVLNNAPGDLCFVSDVFKMLSESNVNIDMISQSPPQGGESRLSFTVSDGDLSRALEVAAKIREVHPQIKLAVSSGNYKVMVTGEAMRNCPGVASKVFSAVGRVHGDVRLITTSEIDISLLLSQPDAQTVTNEISSVLSE